MEITKDAKILAEIKRLSTIFNKLENKTKKAVQTLIENAAFMAVTLQELQDAINTKGFVETYSNGATQSGLKKTSEVDIYNTMIKNYSSIMKQLTDLLPKIDPNHIKADDGFDAFVAKRQG